MVLRLRQPLQRHEAHRIRLTVGLDKLASPSPPAVNMEVVGVEARSAIFERVGT